MVKKTPQDYRVWNNLGETYYYNNEYQQAIVCLSKATAINPNLINSHIRLAECLEKTGDKKAAHSLLNTLLKRPDLPQETKSSIVLALNKQAPHTTKA